MNIPTFSVTMNRTHEFVQRISKSDLFTLYKLPWAITAATILFYLIIYTFSSTFEIISQIGSFLSAAASSLAFVWLVAAYYQQMKELKLQRKELSLQRAVSEKQAEEWKRIAIHSALEKGYQIIEQHERSLSTTKDLECSSYGELQHKLLLDMKNWNSIFNSADDTEIIDLYMRHAIIDAACSEFLRRLISAIELYEQAANERLIFKHGPSEHVLYFADTSKLDIPFIRHYTGIAKTISTQLFLTEPGRHKIKLIGLKAMNRLHPGVVKQEAIDELEKKISEYERDTQQSNG